MTVKPEATVKAATDAAKKSFDFFSSLFTAPSFDAANLFEFQRKNVEAAVEANKIVFEGLKTIAQKQIDHAKDHMAELNEATVAGFANKTPEKGFSKVAELSQELFQKNARALRESSDVFVEANQKAVAVLQARFVAGGDELKAAAK